uniref:Phosphatase and actin regulator n=1 Tax=Rhabditophanes sp. KR3021 TaxID=114890 RepID=A0AC35TGC7_9BILA
MGAQSEASLASRNSNGGGRIRGASADDILNSSRPSRGSKSAYISESIKNKKFWWRIIRPWKWKKSKKARSGSIVKVQTRSSSAGDRPIVISTDRLVQPKSLPVTGQTVSCTALPAYSPRSVETDCRVGVKSGSLLHSRASEASIAATKSFLASSTDLNESPDKNSLTLKPAGPFPEGRYLGKTVSHSKLQNLVPKSDLNVTVTSLQLGTQRAYNGSLFTNSTLETEFPVNFPSISVDNFASIPLTPRRSEVKTVGGTGVPLDTCSPDSTFSNFTQKLQNSLDLGNKENCGETVTRNSFLTEPPNTMNPVLSTARLAFSEESHPTLKGSPQGKSTVFEEVVASVPNLQAQPSKSAIKKPGDSSNKVILAKRASSRRKESQRRAQRAAIQSRKKVIELQTSPRNEDDLPARLTDDSDSEPDIQYRDDYEGTSSNRLQDRDRITGMSGRSTNPLIASKLVGTPSMRIATSTSDTSDDESSHLNGLADRVLRKDTVARRLDTVQIPNQSMGERMKLMHKASIRLERKLSERPLAEELEQRNILKAKGQETLNKLNMDEAKKMLLRKLSFRPTVEELKYKQIIKFNDYVEVMEAEMYDRKSGKPWTKMTPTEKAIIRKELNDYKLTEMVVHEDSRVYTRFHRP